MRVTPGSVNMGQSARVGRGRGAAAQYQVETVAQCPFRLAERGIVSTNQPLARRRVGGALIDRVVFEQRIAGEIHLRDEPCREAGSEHAEMDMRRAPRI